jgi:hypothetical protein
MRIIGTASADINEIRKARFAGTARGRALGPIAAVLDIIANGSMAI